MYTVACASTTRHDQSVPDPLLWRQPFAEMGLEQDSYPRGGFELID